MTFNEANRIYDEANRLKRESNRKTIEEEKMNTVTFGKHAGLDEFIKPEYLLSSPF